MSTSVKVDQFIYSLRPFEKELVFLLRDIIINAHPAIREEWKYNTLFYCLKKNVCYFNKIKKGGVYIGFVYGSQLSNEQQILETGDRKQIRIMPFTSLEDFETKKQLFSEALNEAIILDEISYSFTQ